MPNLYARLTAVKDELGLTTTTHDATMLRLSEAVSRSIDDITGRHFYSEVATRYFDGRPFERLLLGADLLSATTVKVDADGDGVYELTLATPADYWLWPDNKTPKRRVDLNPQSSQLHCFPEGRRRLQIVGTFGYSNDTERVTTGAGAGVDITSTVSASATTTTVTDGSDITAGETLVVGSEQIYIVAFEPVADLITMVRGVNGTTAAALTAGDDVYRRRYPAAIELAALMQVSRFHKQIETGFAGNVAAGDVGGFSFQGVYPAIRDLIQPYIVPVVG